MSDLVFNIAKGKIAYYGGLPAANDALVMIPIQTTGIETDAVLRDYTNLAALLAATNDEQTTMGRKTLANVIVNVDQANDQVLIDCDDVVWAAATGNPISAVLIVYVPDTTAINDANAIPLTKHDFVVTPNGSDVTATIAAGGFAKAA